MTAQFLTLIYLLAGAAVPAAASGGSSSLQIEIAGAERGWIVAFYARGIDKGTTHTITPDVPVKLEHAGDSMFVCAGAPERATRCEEILPHDSATRVFALDEGRRVEGRCFIGRAPLAHAEISVRAAGVDLRQPVAIPLAQEKTAWVKSIRTSDDGEFTIEHLSPGRYVFAVTTADGRAEESGPVTVPGLELSQEGTPPPNRTYRIADIRLAEGLLLSVEVRTPDGMPVAKANVEVVQRDAGGIPRRVLNAVADDDGLAKVSGIDANLPVEMACAAPGYARGAAVYDALPSAGACTLVRLGRISGRITNSNHEPVAGAVAEIGGTTLRAASNSDGSFELTEVAAGAHVIRMSSGTTGTATLDVTVSSGDTVDLGEVVLPAGAVVHGRVVDARSREAVPGASVIVVDPPNGQTAVADEEGAFTLTCDPVASTRVRVSAAGYAVTWASFDAERRTIALERPGAVQVKVWDDATGDACRGCTVIVSDANEVRAAITDASGIARHDGLAPGTYNVQREEIRATTKIVTVSGGGDTRIASVRAGEVAQVELGSPYRRTEIVLSPHPVGTWELNARSGSRVVAAMPAGVPGKYSFRRRPQEAYELTIGAHGVRVTVGSVPATSENEFMTIVLGTATLRVESSPAGMPLSVHDAQGRVVASAVADANGAATIPYLHAGTYRVLTGSRLLGTAALGEGQTANLKVSP